MTDASPDHGKLRRAHPLAIALIARLRDHRGARILEIGAGSGRNTHAMHAAGLTVDAFADGAPVQLAQKRYDGAISTHELLHGTHPDVAEKLGAIAHSLKKGAPLHATFASVRDARYGKGKLVAPDAYAPLSGSEAGIAHAYFRAAVLREMLEGNFEIESMQETNADNIIGRWAHAETPTGVVHWFVRAFRL